MKGTQFKIVRSSALTARCRGFTLIEIAVALVVIAVVLGALLVPLNTQVEQRQISDTQKALEESKEALIGFALANAYLPCPDTDGDGVADPATPGVCVNAEGFLPWVTLSVAQGDVWGNRFRYRVAPEFTNVPVPGSCSINDGQIGLCDSGNITVNTRNPTTKAIQSVATNVSAVIISYGRNGYGAISTTGAPRDSAPIVNADELTNADPPGTTFVSRTLIGVSTPCSDTALGQPFCEFDDIVVWLSTNILFNRMVAAGKLP